MSSNLNQLKYNKVRLDILSYIASHGISVGDKLPPERAFAQILNCSSGTMRVALKDLEDNGLIEKRHGLGNFLRRQVSNMPPSGNILYVTLVRNQNDYFYPPAFLNRFLVERGLRLDHISVMKSGDIPRERLNNCLGIILSGWVTDDEVRNFQALKIPLIVAGNYKLSVPVPQVSADMAKVAQRLTEFFIAQGKRHIVFWGGVERYVPLQEAGQGYEQAMRTAGLPPEIFAWSQLPACQRLTNFLAEHPETEVIIAEQTAFYEYCMVRIEHPEFPSTKFGILPILTTGHYGQGKNILFGDFQGNIVMTAAQELCAAITGQKSMESRILAPVLHGIDDELIDFEVI